MYKSYKQYLITSLGALMLWSAPVLAKVEASPQVTLTSQTSNNKYYQVTFKGGIGSLDLLKINPCSGGTDCKRPTSLYHQTIKARVIENHMATDGAKVIDLGNGFRLSMGYAWGPDESGMRYRLLVPSQTRAELKPLPLTLQFDIVE